MKKKEFDIEKFFDICFKLLFILFIILIPVSIYLLIKDCVDWYNNEFLNSPVYYRKYEVIDYNNNSVIAYNCQSGGYRDGSAMKCELLDGTIISVNEYKYVGKEQVGIEKDFIERLK